MPPLAPPVPHVGDGAHSDNPSPIAGNTSLSQWGCQSGGGESPKERLSFPDNFSKGKNNSKTVNETATEYPGFFILSTSFPSAK